MVTRLESLSWLIQRASCVTWITTGSWIKLMIKYSVRKFLLGIVNQRWHRGQFAKVFR